MTPGDVDVLLTSVLPDFDGDAEVRVEDLTDEQRRSMRVDDWRVAHRLVLAGLNVLQILRIDSHLSPPNRTLTPEQAKRAHDAAICELHKALLVMDHGLELEGQ